MAAGSIDKIINYRYKMHGTGEASSAMHNMRRGAMFAATAIIAAGSALFMLADRTTQAAAHIEDLSRATGIAASELATLGYISEQDGGSIDVMGNSIRKMTRSISDAGDGLATYTREFERIGINVSTLQGLAPEEQFYRIAAAMSEMTDDSQRLSTAQAIFGRGAMAIIPTINRGAEGLQEMAQEARDLGIILDDEAYEASKQFQDALTEIEAQFQSTLLEGLIPLLPAIEGMARDIADLGTEYIPKMISAMENAIPVIKVMADGITMALEGWGKMFADPHGDLMIAQARADTSEMIATYLTPVAARLASMQARAELDPGSIFGLGEQQMPSIFNTIEEIDEEISSIGSGDGGEPPMVKMSRTVKENIKEASDIWTRTNEMTIQAIEAEGTKRDLIMDAFNEEEQHARQVNDIMTQGATDFGRILASGGDDWESKMLRSLAKMAIEFAKMQLAKSLGPLGGLGFSFLGGLI